MAFTFFSSTADIQAYLCTLGRKPRDYTSKEGDTVSFRMKNRSDGGIPSSFCAGASSWPVYTIVNRSNMDTKWALVEALNRDAALQAGLPWTQPARTTRIPGSGGKPVPTSRSAAIAATIPRSEIPIDYGSAPAAPAPRMVSTIVNASAPAAQNVSPSPTTGASRMASLPYDPVTKISAVPLGSGPSIAVPRLPLNAVSYPGNPSPDLLGGILGAVGGFVTGGPAGAVLGGIAGYTGTGSSSGTRGGETPSSPGTTPTGYVGGTSLVSGCPTGYRWDGTQCVQSGIGGTIARILPGGSTGVLPAGGQGYGNAVMGAFGVPALEPAQVGSTLRGPILRCPPGAVLGKDNLCYMKGTITNKQRKWPKAPRPVLSAGDVKTLRKIGSIQNRAKRAWQLAGKPGQRKSSPPRRKRRH